MSASVRLAARVVVLALCVGPWSSFARASSFSQNEVRAAKAKDGLRLIREFQRQGGEPARRFSARVSEALRGEADWAAAAESYYAAGRDLLKRATVLEAKLDAAMKPNSLERDEAVEQATEKILASADALRADFEFYRALPGLAVAPHRAVAQATMRLLAQTRDYPIAFAYYDSRVPGRKPFALQPAATVPTGALSGPSRR